MIILLLNIICAVVVAIIDVQFLVSFEVAFIGSSLVVFSSYKAIMDKIKLMSVESSGAIPRQNAESRKDENGTIPRNNTDSRNGDSIDCYESQGDSRKDDSAPPSLRGDNSPKRALRPQLTHTCKSINENDLIESRRIENAESFKDSSDSTKSSDEIDCHDWKLSQNLAMTTKSNAIKSIISRKDDSMEIPQQNAESRKDENGTIPRNNAESRNGDSIDCYESQGYSADSMQIPRKERIFLGFKLSFGILRLLSYIFVAVSVIVLINHKLFFIAPFLCGVALSSISLALYASKNYP